jgi:pimeloyl-ACP methyl ester carboxylesterase
MMPVVCVPDLVGNSRDFDLIAEALARSETAPRSVYAIDLRGRGLSEWDSDWENYCPLVECGDVLDLVTMAELRHVGFIGTGYGGVIAMTVALLRPSVLGAVVLNDMSPDLGLDFLLWQMNMTLSMPLPGNWDDATRLLQQVRGAQYPRLEQSDWMELARTAFLERNSRPARAFDPAVGRTLSVSRGLAERMELWPQFEALSAVPALFLTGELSNILDDAKIARIARLHPRLSIETVRQQGHPPLLRDQATINLIEQFLVEADAAPKGASSPIGRAA